MAQPIEPTLPAHDPRVPRAGLQSRLHDAPAQHAEALLEGLEVLQGMHDAGVLDLLRGALGSRDKILDIAVRAAGTDGSIRALRNLLLLIDMLGTIEPEALKRFTRAAPQALMTTVREPEPPGLWRLIADFLWNQDFRHGLAAVNTMLEALGRSLSRRDQPDEDPAAAI